jgi:nucleoid-associated protein YgaU
MAARARDRMHGLGALIVALGLLVGVPFVLARFGGWPLPHQMPVPADVVRGLTRQLEVGHVVKAVLVVCWLTWMAMAWSLLAELAGLFSGRIPRPRRSLAPFQAFAGRLVASIAVVLTVSSSAAVAALASPLPRLAELSNTTSTSIVTSAATSVRTQAGASEDATSSNPGSALAISATGDATVTVQPRDTLHRLAEVHLGNAMRWREIWDLNRGGIMADGTTFTRPELIRPGWLLRLPTVVPASTQANPNGPAAAMHIVTEGEDLSTIAARDLGDADRWPEIFRANEGRRFGAATFNRPDLILPGWELQIPARVAEAQAVPPAKPDNELTRPSTATIDSAHMPTGTTGTTLRASSATSSAPSIVTTAGGPVGPSVTVAPANAAANVGSSSADSMRDGQSIERIALALAGATLLATGVALRVQVRRRRRLRSMGPEHRLATIVASAAAAAAEVRAASDPAGISRLDAALRAWAVLAVGKPTGDAGVVFDSASEIRWQPEIAQPLAALAHANGDIDLLLNRPPNAAMEPFVGLADGCTVRLPATVPTLEVAALGLAVASPCPALVGIGSTDTASGSAELYLDLEALGGLSVGGSTDEVPGILRSVAASLAVSPFADAMEIFTTGLDLAGLEDTTRIEVRPDATDAMTAATRYTSGRRHLGNGASGFVLRASEPGDVWETAVVVVAHVTDIADVAVDGVVGIDGVILVCGGLLPGMATTLTQTADGWLLQPLGMIVRPLHLSLPAAGAIGEVLSEASAPPEIVGPSVGQTGGLAGKDDALTTTGSCADVMPYVALDWSFLVRILGPVDVIAPDGEAVAFERSKALELVVWLAQHRANPSRMSARTALWETSVQDATVSNVVSDARVHLAKAAAHPSGEPWIGRDGDRIPLNDAIRTDAELLQAAVRWAQRAPDGAAIEVLTAALELVRDVPFSGTDYLWPDEDALPSNLIHLSTSAAVDLARRCLAVGHFEAVFAATAVGLRVLPGHDELVCLRMQAHHELGNAAGVRSEYAAYERVITSGADGESDPSPRVTRLRADLLTVPSGRR